MSDSSCSNSSNCNVGPQIKIDNLISGEQVVTTVKREKIPEPPKDKPKSPNVVWFILAIYLSMIAIWSLRGGGQDIPAEPYPPAPYPDRCLQPGTPYCP